MSKEFSFPNSGTCSKQTNFVLNDDHTIESMEVIGGCNGNLKGICSIVRGMKAEQVIERFEDVKCGFRKLHCTAQQPVRLMRKAFVAAKAHFFPDAHLPAPC